MPRQRTASRLAETHIQPHLAIGDVAAGEAGVPHRREEPASYPADRDRQKTLARGHNRDHGQLRLRHRTRAAAAARHDHAEPGSRRGYGPRRVAHGYKLET